MASITYDGQSFMLDSRRVWLVSGSIHAARIPRAHWPERIAAAKRAGLNTVETPIFWARHEPRPGQFDFTGENDIRHFVQLVHKAGLFCILRMGPFVDSGYDLGGLPPWLLGIEGIRLRANSQPYLEACSRYITALSGQIRDLQVTAPSKVKGQPGDGGPIIMIQNEAGYTCGDDALAAGYLAELDRYYREAGLSVPIINSNDLWQSVEGEIDGWTGFSGLLSHLRQLAAIRPDRPRFVTQLRVGQAYAWGHPAPPAHSPNTVLRRLAEVLAAGGQFNLDPFCGGTNFGFSAGRDCRAADGFLTTSNDSAAPLGETGLPGPSYGAVRRLCTFASRFARVFANIDSRRQPVSLLPEAGAGAAGKKAPPGANAVIHATGAQGSVAFVFGPDAPAGGAAPPLTLLLSDGSTLPVELGDQSVVWCLLDTRLAGRSHLDYSNLSAFAIIGKVFVCFGPEGVTGELSINGSPLEVPVPSGKDPFVHEHEGVTVVVASTKQLVAIHLEDNAVYIGVTGLDAAGKPVVHPDYPKYTVIEGATGAATPHKVTAHPAPHKHARKPVMGEWSVAALTDYTDGSSARYASIVKPADLVSLGAPYGYGWYRVRFPSGSVHKPKVLFPQAAHRLHLTLDGEPCGLVGVGPGAAPVGSLPLKKKQHTLVALAENLGRVSAGSDLGEKVGIWGPIWAVEPFKPGKPKAVAADPVDVLKFRAPLWRVHRDDVTDPQRLTWTFQHRRKTPIIVQFAALPDDAAGNGGILLLNDKPIHYFERGGQTPIILDPETLGKGKADLQITMLGSTAAAASALAGAVTFYEGVENLTTKAEWAFAKWEPPGSEAYKKPAKGLAAQGGPCWWKCQFNADDAGFDTPLFLEAAGLSKGQVYVNGQHLGRFFAATESGKKVPPQARYFIPRSFLHAGPNDLVIFDEHGFAPSKCRLISDAAATPFE